MTRRQRLFTELLALALTIFISMSLTPTRKSYDSISYSKFKEMLSTQDIDSIGYNEEKKYAVIHSIEENSEYKVMIVSSEIFINDVYDYSLLNGDFHYDTISEPVPISSFSYFAVLIAVNISFRLFMKYLFLYINTKRMIRDSKKNGDNKGNELKYESFSDKLKKSVSGFQPSKVKDVDVTFDDVIGLEKQMNELQDIVSFLKHPEKYEEIGAQLPKGVLLFGQSGVGKTHIARAIAGEAKVPFYAISASELQSKYLGESEERIRSVFKEAAENSPSIIYIDEIDSIAPQRYSDYSNKYSAGPLNQLLACMDGFNKDQKVIVIAATNHVDVLDHALLRPGRFDRKIFIHCPDKEARRKLIFYYSQDKVMAEEIDMERIVDVTAGLTGADIKTILNEAAIIAVRKEQKGITEDTIMEAFRKVEIGSENNYTKISEEQLKRTAIHEAGHAIMSHHFGQSVSEISIIARGRAAGYNLQVPDENSNYSFNELKQRIMCLLGGRAAENLEYDEVSAGASNDLERASSIIKDMFLRFAMDDSKKISLVMTDDTRFNEILAKESFSDMESFFKKCYSETIDILKDNIDILRYLAKCLLEKETLSKGEIEAIFAEIETKK